MADDMRTNRCEDCSESEAFCSQRCPDVCMAEVCSGVNLSGELGDTTSCEAAQRVDMRQSHIDTTLLQNTRSQT